MVSTGKTIYYDVKEFEMNTLQPIELKGKLADQMGLSGQEVTKEIYDNLRDGKDPHTGEQIVKPGPDGTHHYGNDLTFTPHKDWSAAYLAGNAEQRATILDCIKTAADRTNQYIENNLIQVRDSQGNSIPTCEGIYLQSVQYDDRDKNFNIHIHNAYMNITQDAAGNYRAYNAAALVTSREVLTAYFNKSLAEEGLKRGIAPENKSYSTGNSIYTGIKGIDPKFAESISTRGNSIDKYIEQHKSELEQKYPGMDRGELRETIAQQIKDPKEAIPLETIINKGIKSGEKAGVNVSVQLDNIKAGFEQYKENDLTRAEPKMTVYEVARAAASDLTDKESVFSKQELLTKSIRISQIENNPNVSPEKIENAITELTSDKEFINLETGTEKGKGQVEYMTTQEMKTIESNIIKEVRNGQGQREAIMTKEEVQTALQNDKYSHLTNDQKPAIEHVLTSKDRIIAIDGIAGVGKTTLDAVVKDLASERGYQTHGLAPTGTAAEKMEEKGIDSQTIAKFTLPEYDKPASGYGDGYRPEGRNIIDQSINKAIYGEHGERDLDNKINTAIFGERGERDIDHQISQKIEKTGEAIKDAIVDSFTKGHIVIIDEGSMVGSKNLDEAINKIHDKFGPDTLIVLQGDRDQLSPVAAGTPFNFLHDKEVIDSIKMTDTVRFQTDQTKEISKAISSKDIEKTFAILKESNNLHEIKDRDERIAAIVKDYCSRDIKDTIIITATNKDRADINNAIRTELKEQGKIEREGQTYTTREVKNIDSTERRFSHNYETGDQLFCSKSTPGFRPGQEATIVKIDYDKNSLTVEKKNGDTEQIDLSKRGANFTFYREKETEFVKGDRILFLKNDEMVGVKNGSVGTVLNVGEDIMKVTLDNNKPVAFDTKDYSYLTHANCINTHKMQGGTQKEAIVNLDTNNKSMNNYQIGNVAFTRAEDKVTVYANNIEKSHEQLKETAEKINTQQFEKEEEREHKTEDKTEDKTEEKSEDKDKDTDTKDHDKSEHKGEGRESEQEQEVEREDKDKEQEIERD